MITNSFRRSPLDATLQSLRPNWIEIQGMQVVQNFADPNREREQAQTLAICDVSCHSRMGIKGRGGESWLRKQGIAIPQLYRHAELESGQVLILRTGTNEFFIEDSIGGEFVAKLWVAKDSELSDVYRFHRQDAAMLLSGTAAAEVLAETCGYNFGEPDAELVFSRVAGVSCCILNKDRNAMPLFRLWCDGSFGQYLWEELHEIVRDHGGTAVGLSAFYQSFIESRIANVDRNPKR